MARTPRAWLGLLATCAACQFDASGRAGDAAPSTTDAGEPVDAQLPADADGSRDAGQSLSGEALLLRYFLDEAAEQQAPTELRDASDAPMPLPIHYASEMAYAEQAGQRGLEWTKVAITGRASSTIAGTRLLDALEGARRVTIELVVRVDAVTAEESRFFYLGQGSEQGDVSVGSRDGDEAVIRFGHAVAGTFDASLSAFDRAVVHVVIDSTQPEPSDRTALYVNGVAIAPTGAAAPALGATMTLDGDEFLVLGNREIGGRSFDGILFYAAAYAGALDPATIASNASLLLVSDDAP